MANRAVGTMCLPAGYVLSLLDGRSKVTIAKWRRVVWRANIVKGEEAAFDWLYAELGVAKGSEVVKSGVPTSPAPPR